MRGEFTIAKTIHSSLNSTKKNLVLRCERKCIL